MLISRAREGHLQTPAADSEGALGALLSRLLPFKAFHNGSIEELASLQANLGKTHRNRALGGLKREGVHACSALPFQLAGCAAGSGALRNG